MPRLTLCVPNTSRRPDNTNNLYSLGLNYLRAAALRAGWECECLDAYLLDLDVEDCCKDIISRGEPGVIGFSLHTPEMHAYAQRVLERIDPENRLTVIAGGVYATGMSRELLVADARFDYVIRGEGEQTLEVLLGQLKAGTATDSIDGLAQRTNAGEVICSERRVLVPDLDRFGAFAFPWWEGQRNTESASLVTSRGCSGGCSYCIVGPHWGAKNCWRGHSAKWIVERLNELVEQLGTDYIHFVDDEFVGTELSVRRAEELVELIEKSGLDIRFQFMCRADTVVRNPELFSRLRDVGLSQVFIGIESGNDRFLQTWGKGFCHTHAESAVAILNALGVTCCSGTIIFHPLSTSESILVDVEFFERLLNSYTTFEVNGLYEMDVLKGTSIAQRTGNTQPAWLCDLEIADPAAREIYGQWSTVQQRLLIPTLDTLGYEKFKELKREFARWQLQALRGIIVAVNSGQYRELSLQQVRAEFLRFCRKTLGPGALLSLLTKTSRRHEQRKITQEQERCFV